MRSMLLVVGVCTVVLCVMFLTVHDGLGSGRSGGGCGASTSG